MKILNSMLGRRRGGIEQASVDYAEALIVAGHEVHQLLHPGSPLRPEFEALGVTVHTLANLGAWDVFAWYKLRQLAGKIHCDVAIAHGNRATDLLARAGAHPLVTVTHNYKIHCAQADAVLCPTQDLIAYAKAQHAKQTFLLPNMVRVKPSPEAVVREVPVIATMGRFVKKKGMDVFIEALALLAAQGKTFHAVLAGDGEEKMVLQALAYKRGLKNILSFPGWVEDKEAFFAGTDIFCLPSHHEPFGIVLLEAMAYGLPVVATSSEGPREILQLGGGVLVEKGNTKAMAKALGRLLDSPALRESYKNKAYAVVKENYDLPIISQKLNSVLWAILKQ